MLEVYVAWQENGEEKVFRKSFKVPDSTNIPYVKWYDNEDKPNNCILVFQHVVPESEEEKQLLIAQGKIGTI